MPDSEIIQYTIQPGDTIWDLAGQYDLTVDDILDFNPGIDPDDLMVGEVISIPEPFQVQALQPRSERPGGPGRPGRPQFRPPFRPPFRPRFRPYCPAGRSHFVQPGDTLYRIAFRYGVSVSEIVRLNPQVNFRYGLRPGESLCIPFR